MKPIKLKTEYHVITQDNMGFTVDTIIKTDNLEYAQLMCNVMQARHPLTSLHYAIINVSYPID